MKSLILNSASTAYSVLTGRLFRRPERAGDDDLRKGDLAAVCMRNYPEWTLVVWAAQVTGLVLVPCTQSGKVLKRDLRSAIASELRDG
jgi:acyl-CoA synthetase (AMP-forming)/AMP-acid ligase II